MKNRYKEGQLLKSTKNICGVFLVTKVTNVWVIIKTLRGDNYGYDGFHVESLISRSVTILRNNSLTKVLFCED